MKRNVLVLAFIVAFFGLGLITPTTNHETISLKPENLPTLDFTPAAPGDDFVNFVDQQTDLYPPSDIGTHSAFAEMQDLDTIYDTLTEADTGTPDGIETPYANSHITPNIGGAAATNPTNVYGAPDQTYADFSKNSDLIVNGYDTTGMTGTITQVYANITYYGTYTNAILSWYYELDGGANTQIAELTQGGSSGAPLTATYNATSLRVSWTWANLVGFAVGFESSGGAAPTSVYCDAIYLTVVVEGTTVYDLDLEVGWTTADYGESNEYLCIYGGTQGAEALRVDVWNGSWTNVITDLATGWNNVSVSSYLADATFEIRFTDTSDDAVTADTWQVEGVLLHTWTPSYTPTNVQAPTLDNPTDTDNMYAQYLEYQVTTYVSDQNGFGDISYLELGLWDTSESTEYCRFRYDEDTNTFTEVYDPVGVVSLNTGSSSAIKSVNDINATFYFTIDWDFPDSSDLVARCYVIDAQSLSDTDSYGSPSVTWDVETRLDYSVGPSIDDGSGTADRGTLDGAFSLTGTIIYYNSVDNYPASAAVDVWVNATEYGSTVGPWSDTDLTSGAFDVTCYADDVIGNNTYFVKIVEEGNPATSADLYYTTTLNDTYVSDRVQVQSYSVLYDRVNVGTGVNINFTLYYDYDDSPVTDGTVTLNTISATHQGSGVWMITDSEATVMANIYDSVVYSGGTHGISIVDQNGLSQQVIWDQIMVQTTVADDTRVNVGDNVEIHVTLWLVYDSTYLGSGDTVTLDGQAMTWVSGNNRFELNVSQASVGLWSYFVNSSSDASYGITALDTNSQSVGVVWDQIVVQTTMADDTRVNVGNNVEINVTLWLAYDDTPLGSGDTVTLNGQAMTWDSGNSWFDLIVTQATVGIWTYFVNSSTETSFGITALDTNSLTVDVIWDQIFVQTTVADDTRVNVGANAEIHVTLWLAYDSTFLGSGDTVTLNGQPMTWVSGNNRFELNVSQASVGLWSYFVNSSTETNYGITALDTPSPTVTVIWDQIVVQTTTADDPRVSVGADAEIHVTLWLAYDSTFLGSGDTVTLDGQLMTWVSGNNRFELNVSQVSVGLWTYSINSTLETTFGITDFILNGQSVDVIWDQIVVQTTVADDTRVNVGADAEIHVTLWLAYDSTFLGSGDTVTINGQPMTWVSGNNRFELNVSQASVGLWSYFVNSSSDVTYGITALDTNSQSVEVVWDRIVVQTTVADDTRVDVGNNAEIHVTLWLAYDSTFLGSGDTVTLNGQPMTWVSGNNRFELNVSQASVGLWSYFVNSSTETNYGITALDTNSQSIGVVWDRIVVQTTTADDSRVDVGSNAEIYVTLWLAYDSTFLGSGDTVILNGQSMTWVSGNNRFELNVSQASVGLWTYSVNSTSETSFGITALDTSSLTVAVIWDRVQVQSYSVSDGRVSLNENVDINVTLIYAYDSASVTTGTVTINGLSATHQGSGVWKAIDFEPAVIANIYDTVACSGNTYGITNVDPNGQSTSIIWDQLVITIGVDDSTPLNGVQANFSLSVIYDYDDTSCTTYQIVIQRNGTWWHSFTDTNKSSFVDSNFDSSYTYTVFVVTSEFSYGVLSFSTNSQQVVWSAAPNSAPVNDAAPNLANPDDTDNLYARYNFYIITSSVSDADGYNDIEYVELTLYDDSRTTPVWTVRYMVSGGIFSVESGDAYINMSASSFAVGAGNNLDVTWYIKIDWDHSDLIDVDMRQYVYDGIIGAEDFYESNWDVETRLEITGLTIDDGSGTTNRGPLDGAFSVSGTLIYLNSVDNYPLTNETDVWVSSSEYGTSTGPWSDFTLTSGQFGLTVYADDEVGQDTLTVKAVDEAGGSGGTDLLNSITQSTYIADQIAVQSYSALDPRINIDDTATIDVDLLYEYDLSPVINGSVTINGISATHLGSGTWRFTDTKSSVQLFTYNAVTYSGGIHGLTQVNQNAMTQDVIWDQIIVQTTFANDTRVDVGAYAEIRVTLWLAYDSLFLGSGDNVTLAGSAMTWDGSDGRFELAVNQSSVGAWIYFVNSSSESTYGITSLNLSGNNVSIIWDRIQVQSYSVSDDHVNIGDSVNIDVVLHYDYDDSPVTDGIITVNGISATHQGAGLWRFSDSEAAVVMNTYNLVAGSGNIHGLTVVDQNTQTQNVIWDQLVIVIGVDDASLVNGHQANFTLTVTFDYSDAVCTTYQIVIDRNETWWSLFVVANLSQFVDTNTDSTYFYNASSVSSESTYGITAFTTTTQKVTWSLAPNNIPVNDSSPVLTNGDDTDFLYARYRYYIITTSVSDLDGYVDISYVELTLYSDDQTTEYWTIRYTTGTDTFSLESGTSIVVADGMSYANGIGDTLSITWYIKIGWDHAVLVDTDILQFVSDGTDSASNFYETNWNFESRLDYSVAPSLSDDRGDINTADLEGTGSVTYYGSIHSPLANETDVWIVRDGVETWSGDLSAGSFNITSIGSPATVGLNNYTFKVVPEGIGSGGPDLYYTTSLTDTFITDRIEIYEAGVVNGRIDIDTDCEVWWRARYDYDNSTIQSGLILELTGSKVLTWDPTNLYWSWQEASAIPGLAGFDVASASESVYGLTVWFATTSVQQVIWDSLVITFTDPTDSRIDVGTNATGITVSAVHAYDSTAFDGSLILNNSVFQYATPQKQGYTVNSASGGTYGITAIGINDETYCIWDRVLVVSVVADEAYHDPNDNVMLSVELQYEYDHSPVLAGSFALAGYSLTHSGAGVWEVPVTVGSYQSIDFNNLTSCNATLHVITEYNMNSNSVTVYWDRIEFHSVTVDDDRVNIGDSVQIRWSARLENAGIDIPSGIVAMMTGDVTCMPSGGFYAASVSQSTIGSSSFSIISASLGEISQFIQSSADATVIWDRVKVASITATTPSVDAGTNAEIRVTLVYEFDNTPVTDGSVYLDNGGVATPMTYNSAGYWTALVSRTTAGNYTFTVDSVSGNAFGVSSLNTDGLSVQVEWVLVPGFAPDPMTLMIVGGGVGIALVGAAIVVSRRRRGAVSAEVGDLEASDFGVPEVVEEEPVSVEIEEEPVTEPEAEPEMEPGESEVSESEVAVSEAEVESISEPEGETEVSDVEEIEVTEPAIEAETLDQMEEIEPEEVELPPVEEDFSDLETGEMELEPELEEIKETPPAEEEIPVLEAEDVEVEPEPEVPVADEVELPEEELEVEHKKPIVEPEQEPEVEVEEPIEPPEEPEAAESEEQVPEEFVEPIPKVDLSTLTKGELLDMIPDDIKATTPTSELKRLTKIELISLIESLLDAEE